MSTTDARSAPILVVGGPTAAGKTALTLELAEELASSLPAGSPQPQLVSADAMQVYRGMDIGTAKPDLAVRRAFPHACMDVVDPNQDYSVADFVATVRQLHDAGHPLIIVGGTPFWLRALVAPLAALPASDPDLRRRLAQLDAPHAALAAVDPQAASRLHPNDLQRVIRALEIHTLTGHTQTELWARGARQSGLSCEILWLDRDDLRPRIGLRLRQMMDQGYLDEVRGLLAAGYSLGNKPMRSLGYRHLSEHIDGLISLDEALRRTERDTWRLARKQRTWARGLGWSASTIADAASVARAFFAR